MGLDSHNSVKIWGNLNNFWLSLFDKVFSGETIWSKSILRIRSSTYLPFLHLLLYLQYLIGYFWVDWVYFKSCTRLHTCHSVGPSIHPSIGPSRITAPAHPYATDAVVHTALFETDIKPCSMLLINFVFLIHRSISPSNSQSVCLSIRRAV